jgi:hypothetical protein
MPTSATDIANLALTKLGASPIAALTDDSKAARTLSAVYDSVRDAELRDRPWKFAMTRAALPSEAQGPGFGYGRQYLLPSDCIRLIQVGEGASAFSLADYQGPDNAPFQVDGEAILTDMPAPLRIRYVRRVTDVSRYDAAFVQAFACRLAAEAAEALTQSPQKRQLALGEYQERIRQARRLNAIEQAPEAPADDSWIVGRL